MKYQPFCASIPENAIYRHNGFEQALAKLSFSIQQSNIALITGVTGSGKSTLLRCFSSKLKQQLDTPIYLHHTSQRSVGIMRMIATSLGEEPRSYKDRVISQIITRVSGFKNNVVLLVDEAHNLPKDALIDLRLLVCSSEHELLNLKLVLCGQNRLSATLRQDVFADIISRIPTHVKIKNFAGENTQAYIDHLLKGAGVNVRIFEPEAISAIHDSSDGNPQMINKIATLCLLAADSDQSKKVGIDIVKNVLDNEELF